MGSAPHTAALVIENKNSLGETLGLIGILVAVLLFAYYATRIVGARSAGFSKAAHMRVKERVMLAKDKSAVLLETKNKVYLLGVTAQSVQLIAALDPKELGTLEQEQPAQRQGAKEVLASMGIFGGRKGGGFRFGGRKEANKTPANEDELDALLSKMQQRRNERYGSWISQKPEFQEILDENIHNEPDEPGDHKA